MNDRLEPDALDRALDAALRRRFEAPATLETLAARALARRPHPRRLGPMLVLVAAALAAAVLALWIAPWERTPVPVRSTPAPRYAAESKAEPDELVARGSSDASAAACLRVGPLESSAAIPEMVRSPDLTRLYSTMDACRRSAAARPCPENDELAERLAATYGAAIELSPDALGFLQGPFASADWPTATILTGVAENQTSVLVAERDATLDCCLCMDLPEQSGLRMFTWQVGNVVLTEITPLAEPRLLQFFE